MYEHENCASEDGNSFERNCGAASVRNWWTRIGFINWGADNLNFTTVRRKFEKHELTFRALTLCMSECREELWVVLVYKGEDEATLLVPSIPKA